MKRKLHIKKGDVVYVNAGEDKGKTGKVLQILVKTERAIVEGVNMVKKHTKPDSKNTQGGIIEKEAPIHISNLQLADANGKPIKTGRRISESTGKLVRYSKKTNEEIK
ncbi:MAG: 50S ribosomal protein L24 [Prevotellaceae bacterium]|jgi:large subunit ribosomal protein L24|nr:50S ribosomal protein L24 [Prevotellaceae bacterium]